jgi:hypothetical protein
MKTPILGSSYVLRSPNAADSRMVNLYPEVIPEGGKEAAWLQRAPGLRALTQLPTGPVRGLWQYGNYGYAVAGSRLYQINSDWTYIDRGQILGTDNSTTQPVNMVDNGTQMFIAADANGYIYNNTDITLTCNTTNTSTTVTTAFTGAIWVGQPVSGSGIPAGTTVASITNDTTFELSQAATATASGVTLAFTPFLEQITDPDFYGAVGVGFLDGYFVFNEPNSQRLWVTESYNGTAIDSLAFASAEGSPDDLVTLIVDHREVWLFGVNTVEVWYNAGTPDFPLARIQGAFNEIGCLAAYSVAKLDNGLFWLGRDARGNGVVYRSKGYSGERVSTHAVEWQIQQYTDLSDAVAYTYQQDGHSFYVLNFPTANTTWVYDVATGLWHERAGWENNQFTRHRGNCQMNFSNEIVIGDYVSGFLFAYDPTVYTEAGTVQKWLRSWRALPTGENNLKRTTQHSLQLDCETGVGLNSNDYGLLGTTYLITEDVKNIITEDGDFIVSSLNLPAPGIVPQVMLRWSDDGGHTWSSEHWKSMGQTGQYGKRVIWRRLGMTQKLRDRVYEISGTDPVKIAIMGAELILSPTNA